MPAPQQPPSDQHLAPTPPGAVYEKAPTEHQVKPQLEGLWNRFHKDTIKNKQEKLRQNSSSCTGDEWKTAGSKRKKRRARMPKIDKKGNSGTMTLKE